MEIKDTLVKLDLYKYIENIKNSKDKDSILSNCNIKKCNKYDFLYFNSMEGNILILLSGKVNIKAYLNIDDEYTVPWDDDIWLGSSNIISNNHEQYELTFLEDSSILFYPLKKLIKLIGDNNCDLWRRLCKLEANNHIWIKRKAAERLFLPKEIVFLKFLVQNNYSFIGMSTEDISEKINMSTRTIQRITHKFVKLNLIRKDRSNKSLHAINKEMIDSYLLDHLY